MSTETLKDLGITAYQAADYKSAVQFLNKALAVNSSDPQALFYRGLAGLQGLYLNSQAGILHALSGFGEEPWWGLLKRTGIKNPS